MSTDCRGPWSTGSQLVPGHHLQALLARKTSAQGRRGWATQTGALLQGQFRPPAQLKGHARPRILKAATLTPPCRDHPASQTRSEPQVPAAQPSPRSKKDSFRWGMRSKGGQKQANQRILALSFDSSTQFLAPEGPGAVLGEGAGGSGPTLALPEVTFQLAGHLPLSPEPGTSAGRWGGFNTSRWSAQVSMGLNEPAPSDGGG